MKNYLLIKVHVFMIAGLITFVGCDTHDRKIDEASIFPRNGYIKGTVHTKRENGVPVSYTFDYQFTNDPTVYNPNNTFGFFYMERIEDIESISWASLEIDLNKGVPVLSSFFIQSYTYLSNDTLFYNYLSAFSGDATVLELSDYVYDEKEHSISGSFKATSSVTYTGHESTVSGSFYSTVTTYDIPDNATVEFVK